jgi:hypothetical protein
LKQLKQNFQGIETNLFFGRVVNRFDDNERGRVRIRIFGIHPEDTTLGPDEDLPWAWPIQSLFSAAVGEVGMTPHALMEDSVVFGMFQDGADGQIPVILGTLQKGALPPLSIGTQSLPKGETVGIEPGTPYAAEYPFNKVFQSESGHAWEFDDTPGHERIHVFHRMGSYAEIGPDGSMVVKVIGDGYSVFVKDSNVYVQGQTNIYANGNLNINAYNDANINVSGDTNLSVAGDFRVKASEAFIEAPTINLKGNVLADTLEAGSIEAGPISAASVQSTFSPGSGSPASPEASGLNTPQERDVELFVPNVDEYRSLANDDLEEDQVDEFLGDRVLEEPASVSEPTSPVADAPVISTLCGITITEGQALDPIQLTPNFTVGKLSSFARETPHRVKAQRGLEVGEIVCNLKRVAENCLEPLYARYGTLRINSGFRDVNNTSNPNSRHCLGEAIDVRVGAEGHFGLTRESGESQRDFINRLRAKYHEEAAWVAANVPYDQFILETLTTGTNIPWWHISFSTTLRRQYFTMNNHRRVGAMGELRLITI